MTRAWICGLVLAMLAAGPALAQEQTPVQQALALVESDPARARAILAPAADDGDVDAKYTLAAMLATGLGGDQDGEEAREWYYLAAQAGSAKATRALGMMVFTGEGGGAAGLRHRPAPACGGGGRSQCRGPAVDDSGRCGGAGGCGCGAGGVAEGP